ncbi:hypothetical protein BV898_06063 [Hypsibius exemplaris]|uniref:Plasma membrane proteolipid 3 n=1 Tax=Hypsibius exemplaris TaxID=2072580 RepID=A0A1W0WX62_HYPEX|nr:hypothetical protein BV898_06063 [Hypsibius exemplaris]
MALTPSDIIKFIAAVFLPPLGVFLETGCDNNFIINVLLTCLFWVPGIIHAFYIILKTARYKMPLTCTDIFKFIAAVFLPPLGVFLETGCDKNFLINFLLTCLFWVPGMIHAFYIICKY